MCGAHTRRRCIAGSLAARVVQVSFPFLLISLGIRVFAYSEACEFVGTQEEIPKLRAAPLRNQSIKAVVAEEQALAGFRHGWRQRSLELAAPTVDYNQPLEGGERWQWPPEVGIELTLKNG